VWINWRNRRENGSCEFVWVYWNESSQPCLALDTKTLTDEEQRVEGVMFECTTVFYMSGEMMIYRSVLLAVAVVVWPAPLHYCTVCRLDECRVDCKMVISTELAVANVKQIHNACFTWFSYNLSDISVTGYSACLWLRKHSWIFLRHADSRCIFCLSHSQCTARVNRP